MKKIGQAVLIGGILVFLGFCVLMASAFLGYFQSKGKATNKLDNSQWIEKEYQCDNITEISNIEILLVDEEVKFEVAEDNKITIKYYDKSDKSRYSIEEKKDTLTMKRIGEKNVGFKFFNVTDIAELLFNREEAMGSIEPVRIYVPESYIGNYKIDIVSGEVSLLELGKINKLEIESVSGGIYVEGIETTQKIEINSISGSITLKQVYSKEEIEIATTSGAVGLSEVSSDGELACDTVSGDINGSDVSAKAVNCETTSGGVNLKQVAVEEKFNGESVSGGYYIEFTDSINNYTMDFDSVSGSCNQGKGKHGNGDKELSIETTSGSINVTFMDE